MSQETISSLVEESRRLRAELRQHIAIRKEISLGYRTYIADAFGKSGFALLDIAEGLIVAHRAAKRDDDGHTLDLIEDAMFHVGRRLDRERAP